jgi:predicted transcriptional regulator
MDVGTITATLRLRDELTSALTKAQSHLESFAGSAIKAGTVLSIGVTAPILAVGGAAIKMGIDAVESANLVKVSFGDMASAAHAWAAKLSESFGLNRYETEKLAGTLFTMTTGMGLSKDAAFEMSTGIVQLAADMASFRNIPFQEAFDKIRAGIVGETEPLRQLGILVDENTVKTYAYSTGIARQGDELTAQQKVLARWGAILKQTSNDQGDLARTLESPANQLRIMRSRIEEATTALGMALIPVVSSVTSSLLALTPYLQRAADWFGRLPDSVRTTTVVLAAMAAATGPLLVVLGSVAAGLSSLSGFTVTAVRVLTTLGNTVPVITARLWLMDAAQKAVAISTSLSSTALGAFVVASGPVIAAIAGITAAATIGYQAWKLYQESQERAAMAARQAVIDQANLERLNKAMGTSYKTLDEAVAAYRDRQKELSSATKPVVDVLANLKQEALALAKQALVPLSDAQKEVIRLFAKAGLEVKDIASKMGLSEQAVRAFMDTEKKAADEAKRHADAVKELRDQLTGAALQKDANELAEAFRQLTPAQRDSQTVMTRFAEEARKLQFEGAQLTSELQRVVEQFGLLKKEVNITRLEFAATVTETGNVRNLLAGFNQQGLIPVTQSFVALVDLAPVWRDKSWEIAEAMQEIKDQARELAIDALAKMSQAFSQMAQVAGGALKGVLGFFSQLTNAANVAVEGVRSIMAGLKSIGEGGATNFLAGLGSLIPGVGAIVGSVVGFFGKLFGKSEGRKQLEEANKQIAQLKEEVIALYGSTEQAEAIATRLGINFANLWSNQNKDGLEYVKKQVDALATALEKQKKIAADLGSVMVQRLGKEAASAVQPLLDKLASLGGLSEDVQKQLLAMTGPDFRAMEEAAARYGIAQEALGQGYWQAKLDQQFLQVVADYKLLTEAGVNAGVVLEGMGPKVSELVQQALKYGVELPAGMKPIIETLAEAGLLVDENGMKLEGLEKLTFAETLTQGIDRIVAKLQELIDTLTKGVTGGFKTVMDEANKLSDTEITVPVKLSPFWDSKGAEIEIPRYQHGGVVTRPTLALIGEGGPEAVVPLSRVNAIPSTPIGGPMEISLNIDGRQLATILVPYLPGAVRSYRVG